MMPRPDLGGRIEEQGLVSPPARTSSSRLILELPPPIQEIGLPSAGGLVTNRLVAEKNRSFRGT
jgi:hypothetical protein